MKTYLVTGAAGFIGARFVESLNQRSIRTISVDRASYFRDRSEHHSIEFGQIIDREKLFEILPSLGKIDAIVHMGACSKTTETDLDYLQKTNVIYSQKLWKFCTEHRIPFIYASSAATYGDGDQGYDDDEATLSRLKPLNAYGQSKQTFDVWALSEEKKGNHPPVWSGFKFFNVYGFGERHKIGQMSVILHAYDQILKTGKVKLFKSHRAGIADGEQRRDFVAVEDVTQVLHFALEKPIKRGIFNLGTGHAQTFLDLARAVFAALGKSEQIEFIDTPPSIRDKYQYFTEAKMDRLRAEGYSKPFSDLSKGARDYVKRLQSRAVSTETNSPS